MKYIIVIGGFVLFLAAVAGSSELNTPFVFDFFLGLVAGALLSRPMLRLIGWFVIPLAVAFISFKPHAFLGPGELQGTTFLGVLYFAYLFGLGLVASGGGTVLGSFLRSLFPTRS